MNKIDFEDLRKQLLLYYKLTNSDKLKLGFDYIDNFFILWLVGKRSTPQPNFKSSAQFYKEITNKFHKELKRVRPSICKRSVKNLLTRSN